MNTDDAGIAQRGPDEHPDGVAVLPGGVSVSYQESEVAALATALADLGVRPQDRILIVMPDGSGFAEAVIGTIQQAAVPVPINAPVPVGDLARLIAETGARLMIVAEEEGSRLMAALGAERAVPVGGRPDGTWATVLLFSA